MTKHSYAIEQIADRRAGVIVRLPPEVFTVLTQVRGHNFEIAEDILPSILARGQITPGLAAALTLNEGIAYIDQVNIMFNSSHTIDEAPVVVLDGKEYVLPLAFGHRRLLSVRAVNALIAEGKGQYTENFDGLYKAELHFGLTANEAIELQFNENRHSVPSPHMEARKAWGYYRFLQRENPTLSVTEFAARIGRKPEWVRNALRFCSLPANIQGFVDGDNELNQTLPYGVLVHLARLIDGLRELNIDFPEEHQKSWLLDAVVDSLDTTSFGKKVTEFLNDKREVLAGQRALFDLSQTDAEQDRRRRQIIDAKLTMAQWNNYAWLDKLSALVKSGAFGDRDPLDLLAKEGLFSPGSPVRVMAASLQKTALLLPVLAQVAGTNRLGHKREFEEAAPYIQQMAQVLTDLLAKEKPVVIELDNDELDLLPIAAE